MKKKKEVHGKSFVRYMEKASNNTYIHIYIYIHTYIHT